MANEQDKKPPTGEEADISKAQSAQQPTGQQAPSGQQTGPFETGQQTGAEQTGDQTATGEAQSGQAQTGAGPDEGLQGETATDQRTDIEGASLQSEPTGQAEGGFVGARGEQDSSRELIDEDEEDEGFTPEGK